MNRLIKIDSIMYYVKNLEKSTNFYTNVLGLKKVWEDKKNNMIGLVFENSDSEIVLHSNSDIPNPDFSFLVDNTENFCGKFVEMGYSVQLNPIEVRCGKFAILLDLDNNPIPIIDLSKFNNKPKFS